MSFTPSDSAAQLALDSARLRWLCTRVGDKPVSRSEQRELVDAGLAYFTHRQDGRAGTDMILTAVGRLAARVGRFDQLLAEQKEASL